MKPSPIAIALAFTCCVSLGCRVMADDTPAPIPAAAAEANNSHDLEQSARLKQGLDLAAKGNREVAIRDYYDPVIAYYEGIYSDKRKHYFSARGATEALLYALDGARTKTDTVVVSRNWVEAHFMKGFVLVELGQLNAALAELDAALKLAPNNSQVRAEVGSLYTREKDYSKALESYKRAEQDAEFSPPEAKTLDHVRAYHGLGYAYTELGQWDNAEEMYQKALAIDSNDQHSLKELQYIQQQRNAHSAPVTPQP
jgi:tetratricopeptide (TPR) repeat protein